VTPALGSRRASDAAPLATTTLLTGLYVACGLITSVTASTPVLLGQGFAAPGGVFLYALTFTLLDLAHERLGHRQGSGTPQVGARRLVYTGFAANVLLAGYVQLVAWLSRSVNLSSCLSSAPRIVVASLAAYLLSSLLDVYVFAWWRRRGRGPRWAGVLASNSVSTLLDSVVFAGLAFGPVLTGPELPVLPRLIAGQYTVKMAVTLVSLPLIYLIHTHWRKTNR
jgi:uncharacterized integral membrane protein (TIGR00697 family)